MFLVGRQKIELRRVPMVLPGPGEILIRVRAANTCGTDVKAFRIGGHPRMLKVPSVFGHEVAGTVAATGADVEHWQSGDSVVVVNSASCGRCTYCRKHRENLCANLRYLNGAFADYLLVPRLFVERSTFALPPGLTPDVGALAEPLACVLHGVETCSLSRPSQVLVLGAGPIGQLLVGVLASQGHRVCLVDSNEPRRALALSMGAAAVWDRNGDSATGASFDLAVDATGTLAGWNRAVRAVHPGGQVLFFGGCPPGSRMELDTGRVHYDELTLRGAYHHRPATVRQALDLLAKERFPAARILTARMSIEETQAALESMMLRQNMKVVLEP